jgi:hypothetical protein
MSLGEHLYKNIYVRVSEKKRFSYFGKESKKEKSAQRPLSSHQYWFKFCEMLASFRLPPALTLQKSETNPAERSGAVYQVRRARARGTHTHNHRDETDRRVVEGQTRVTKKERLGNCSDTQHVQSAKGRELDEIIERGKKRQKVINQSDVNLVRMRFLKWKIIIYTHAGHYILLAQKRWL